ncbi:MAG TPA: hypothetical protein VH437_10340 [Terriglobales bacterium]|jgi:hypothetical protein
MVRWIAFDDESAEAVVSRFERGAAEIQAGDPVDAALALDTPSLVLLPSKSEGKVLIAHFEPKNEEATTGESGAPKYEASGFLGLRDEPVFIHDDPHPPKKSWWRRRPA